MNDPIPIDTLSDADTYSSDMLTDKILPLKTVQHTKNMRTNKKNKKDKCSTLYTTLQHHLPLNNEQNISNFLT